MELNAGRFPSCTEDRAEEPPQVRWEERWGAIVMDAASGMTGIGGSQPTEEAAIQTATAMCQRKGGKSCRVDITYSNQCGALAWGSNHAVSARGRTLEIASKYAIDACEKTTGKCEVFFSIAACRCGSSSQVGPRVNHGAIVCSRFLPPLKPHGCPRSGRVHISGHNKG